MQRKTPLLRLKGLNDDDDDGGPRHYSDSLRTAPRNVTPRRDTVSLKASLFFLTPRLLMNGSSPWPEKSRQYSSRRLYLHRVSRFLLSPPRPIYQRARGLGTEGTCRDRKIRLTKCRFCGGEEAGNKDSRHSVHFVEREEDAIERRGKIADTRAIFHPHATIIQATLTPRSAFFSQRHV